jgi:fimbrial chaperone protein
MSAQMPGLRGFTAAIVGAVIVMTAPARAANFAISPVDVTLANGERSHLIAVTNRNTVPLRFQLSAYLWKEQPDGRMALTPTDDVIFFPRLFSVQPGEAQNIRVGTIVPATEDEMTYRLVIRQLKSFEPPHPVETIKRVTVITVLTNVSIPVFVEPPVASAQADINSLALRNGTLSFVVRNSGNAHFRIKYLRVEGFGAGPQPVFSKTAEGWYVLAHGSRDYRLAVPSAECSRVNRMDLSVQTDRGELRNELPVSAANCGVR